MAKKKSKSLGLSLELVGNVYIVEKFSDGLERRDIIDGDAILKLLEQMLEQALKDR